MVANLDALLVVMASTAAMALPKAGLLLDRQLARVERRLLRGVLGIAVPNGFMVKP